MSELHKELRIKLQEVIKEYKQERDKLRESYGEQLMVVAESYADGIDLQELDRIVENYSLDVYLG
jgi:hypothetical protein